MILAHGIGGRSDLPLPVSILVVGAAAVLVVSFVALGMLWTRPRFQDGPRYDGASVRVPTRTVLAAVGLVGLLLVIGQVVPPLLGMERSRIRPTVAPVAVWVALWLVVPITSAVIGNWYADLNPWRTLARGLGIGNQERIGLPHTVGLWPATVVFLAFAWFELVSPHPGDPTTLGFVVLGYTVFLLGAMSWAGRESGLAVFDFFTPYNRLISAISPLGRNRHGEVVWRGWLRALAVIPEWPGLWVFAVVMIATVSYDGAVGSEWLRALGGGLVDTTGGRTVLLLVSVAVVALGYYLACAIAARLSGGGWRPLEVAQRFAHTLIPIGLAYALSHYFTLVLFEGQQMVAALSDPFGLGWDLFGTSDYRVDFFIRTSTPVWLSQVAFIVGGHLAGVVLAHDRSLQDFGGGAGRSQYAMLVLMIALTSLALLILSG
ncbi:MAG TPA: hypothetical protein VMP13_08245 [Acidimicrobiia bacterium]|nr:hypothetical protein [Acidimicrobiia bacterium]